MVFAESALRRDPSASLERPRGDELSRVGGLYVVTALAGERPAEEEGMPDVTFKRIDEMDGIFDGVARRARAELGVTAWGMQVFTLPANWDGYPEHKHDSEAFDPNQEEVYIPLEGSARLVADEAEYVLRPGTMARVGPEQARRILPGPEGFRFVALGGRPGSFEAGAWTEIGADPPSVEG